MLTAEAGTPPWLARLVNAINGAFLAVEFPKKPVRVPAFLEVDLPPADEWPNCVVRVSDTNCLAFSDGTDWLKADGSAL